jgi:small subunit ribosomal protein S4
MARNIGPVCRLCRREGQKLFLKGSRCLTNKCAFERRGYSPGQHGGQGQFRRGRASDYSVQLREKQKVKRIYGVLERQFRRYFRAAQKHRGLTGQNLLITLESRLDNVVYRLGFADSRAQGRQLVQHGHFMLNGRRTTVPSALVKPGDVIAVREGSTKRAYFKALREELNDRGMPKWLAIDPDQLSARVLALPTREDIDPSIKEQLIVEYYSR